MVKKIGFLFVFSSTFLFTGCLEELLASLCDKLASNSSIIAVLNVTPADYSAQPARLTYINVDDGNSTYTISQCSNKFDFPNGERKENTGVVTPNITFVSVLDEAGYAFFFDGNGVAKGDNIRLEISFFNNCDDMNANPVVPANSVFGNDASILEWIDAFEVPEEPIPLLGECEITGQSAVVTGFSEI